MAKYVHPHSFPDALTDSRILGLHSRRRRCPRSRQSPQVLPRHAIPRRVVGGHGNSVRPEVAGTALGATLSLAAAARKTRYSRASPVTVRAPPAAPLGCRSDIYAREVRTSLARRIYQARLRPLASHSAVCRWRVHTSRFRGPCMYVSCNSQLNRSILASGRG